MLRFRCFHSGLGVWATLVAAALLAGVACSDAEDITPSIDAGEPGAAEAPAPPNPTASPTPEPSPPPAASPTPRPPPAPFVPRRVTTPTPTPVPQAVSAAALARTWSYNEAPCRFDGMWDFLGAETPQAECGYLTVPQDRTRGDGPTLRLHVAVFKARTDDPPSYPIVYLEGGPGGHALATAALGFDETFLPYQENRDFIMFDQRGTGFSEPALECPESSVASDERAAQHLTVEEDIKGTVEAINACRDRLVSEGVDLAAYSSRESAADLNALREALGYDEWNLYGISYGTKLALTAIRDFPEGIRSVILDSTHPLEVDFYSSIPRNADRAFGTLFDSCASDPLCGSSYPDLRPDFYELVDTLNREPVLTEIAHPITGNTLDVLITGDVLVDFLFQTLYSTDLIPLLPEVLSDVNVGNLGSLNTILGLLMVTDDVEPGDASFLAVRRGGRVREPGAGVGARRAVPQAARVHRAQPDIRCVRHLGREGG